MGPEERKRLNTPSYRTPTNPLALSQSYHTAFYALMAGAKSVPVMHCDSPEEFARHKGRFRRLIVSIEASIGFLREREWLAENRVELYLERGQFGATLYASAHPRSVGWQDALAAALDAIGKT
jgi:hypothetical protein